MFKLIIVDDEIYTRKSLQNLFNWDEYEIGNVKTAKDGLEALEISKEFNPDILISDVRMPKMDGIELATHIRERFPSCKIIFLSGFADKEYLKSAIYLNALSYIEKPIDADELKQAVFKAVTQLKEDMKKQTESLEFKKKISNSIPLVQNELVIELIKENQDEEKVFRALSDTLPQFPLSGIFQCASVVLNWSSTYEIEKKSNKFSSIVTKLFNQFCNDSYNLLVGFKPEKDEIILIAAAVSQKNQLAIIDELFSKIHNNLHIETDDSYHISMGIGNPVKDIQQLNFSYTSATEALKQSFYNRKGNIFRTVCVYKNELPHEEDFQNKFREILQKTPTSIESIIKKLTSDIIASKNTDPSRVINFFSGLLLEAIYTAEIMMLLNSSYKMKIPEILNKLVKSRTIYELFDFTLSNISYIFNPDQDQEDTIHNRKIQEVILYVNKNYADSTMTLQDIANSIYINPNYLSNLFKKITGKNLNEYINIVRVENAKKLLTDSSIKVYEISEHIGFCDPNYFATIFKKYVGCTPSQYRNTLHSK